MKNIESKISHQTYLIQKHQECGKTPQATIFTLTRLLFSLVWLCKDISINFQRIKFCDPASQFQLFVITPDGEKPLSRSEQKKP